MDKKLILSVLLFSFLFFGCISLSIEQKVEKDGSSFVTQKMDMSGFVSYIESMQSIASGSLYFKTIEPNSAFKLSDYASYPTAESKGLLIEVTGNDAYAADSRYNSASFYLLNNNNYTIKNVIVSQIKSYAFIEKYYSASASNLGSLGPGEGKSSSVSFLVANVTPGAYPMVFIISFYDDKNTKQNVSYTINFTVTEKKASTDGFTNYSQNLTNILTEACINATKKDPGITCNYTEDGVLTLSKNITAEKGGYNFTKESRFPYIVYVLKTDHVPQILADDTLGLSSLGAGLSYGTSLTKSTSLMKFTDPGAKISVVSAKLMNAKITYTIEMPGDEIITAKNGKIEGKKAIYDVLELMDKGNVVEVESRELDVFLLSAIGGGVILLAILAIVAFFAMTKK